MKAFEDFIPEKDCIEFGLYRIYSRHASVGIFIRCNSGDHNSAFLINRFKFFENFLFEEYHWDYGENFGTVKPFEIIEMVPDEIVFKIERAWLDKCGMQENDYQDILDYLAKKYREMRDNMI